MYINFSSPPRKAFSSSKKILIADDEEDIRIVFSEFLKNTYLIKTAKDGLEAIDLANEWKPDLILMDVKMPKLDGLEASRIILSHSKLPIIAITAFQGRIKQKVEELGIHYLRKPLRLNCLLEKIETLLSNKQ